MPLISAVSWAVGPTSAPIIPKTFHSPGNPPGGGGGSAVYGSTVFDGTGDSLSINVGGAGVGGSTYFDGSGDYLESASSLDFTMGTGDFTVECWFKPAFDTSVNNTYHAYMWEIGNQRVYITIDDGKLYLANAFIGAIANVSIGNIQNQWHHVAVTKASNVYTLWYDGQSQGTASDSNEITGPTGNEDLIFRIANHTYWGSTNYEFNGYISNMRVIKGTAIYTSAFTPSTSPLTAISGTVLLTCQNSTGTITDASSSNHTMTVYGNSIASSDNPFATTLNMGAGDWTIEWWMQISNQNPSTNSSIFDTRGGGPASGAYHVMQVQTNRTLMYFTNGNSKITTNTVLDTGTWYHVALQKSGNVTTLYLDGVAEGTYADTQTYLPPQNNIMIIGADDNNSGYYYNGFLSNFRMVKGNTAYTPNGGSAYFDGTGDSLDVGTFTIGTDAFTIESWFQPKFNTNGSDTVFLYDVSSEDIRVTFKNGNIRAQLGSETELSYSIGTLDYNTWYYTALQRDSSGNVNFYFDGAVVGNYNGSGQNVSGNTLRIGDKQAGSKEFHGYISNFRIVRGNALYPPANGGSASFDGTGDSIDTTNPLPVTGDFTMEGWIYPTTSGLYDGYFTTCLDSGANGGIVVAKDKFFVTHGGGSSQIGFSSPIENNVWSHIALQRSGNVFSLYKDGSLQGTTTVTVSLTGSTIRLGSRYTNTTTYQLTGFLSNFRIVTGTTVYSGAFTPSTSPLTAISGTQLLTCQNGTGSITDASSNNYTITPNGNTTASGSSPFAKSTTPLTDITNTKLLTCNTASGTIIDASSNNHTVTTNGDTVASGENPFYTTYSFTPSTAPLTDVTGTQLLTAFNPSGAITDSSSNTYTITAHGNARASQNNPFGQDGGYMYFNGVNSYYRATGISSLIPQMETTSATIEFWFQIQQPNNSGYPSTQIAINLDDPTNSTSYGRSNHHLVLQFNMNGESGPYFRGDSQHANYYYNFDAFTNFQWYHFAYVQKYDGSNLTAAGFINGKQIKDTKNVSVTSAMSISGYNELEIGGANNTSYTGGWNTYDFTGLIHDVRFVYGTAVYDIPAVDTGLNEQRFTPPSAKLTATGGTYPSTTNVNTNIPAGHTILLTDIVGGELVDTTGNMTFTKGGNPYQIMSTGSYTPYDTLYPNRTTNGWYTNTNFTSSNPQNDVTEIKGVATGDSTNNIIIAGSDAGTDKFGMIGSYDTSTGSSNWHTQVGQNTDINNVIMKRKGGYVGHSVVCGQDFGHRHNMTPSVGLGYVGLFDTTGGSQWQRIVKPTSIVDSNDGMDIKDVAEDSLGNIWAFGESRVNGANAGNYETWHLIKMDKDGIYQSSWAYGGTTQQFARKMAIDKDDNIYLCGYIYDPTGGNNYPHGLVMKIHKTGSLTWSKIMGKNYTGVHYDQFDDIGLTELGSSDGDGLVILGGSTTHTLGNSATQGQSKPWVVALNQSDGAMVMSKISNDTNHIGVTSMFVRDNEIWCVITDRDQSPYDFLLVKYGLGANLMEKYSISYSNSNTTCRDSGTLSVDTNGNLVIGATRISGGNYRWYPTVMPADIESKKGTYGEIDIGNTTFGETNLSDVAGITNGYTYSNIVGQTTSMTIVDGFDSGSSAQPLIVATSPPYTDSGSPGNVIG